MVVKTFLVYSRQDLIFVVKRGGGVTEFLKALWAYLTLSAPYLLLGLFLSGVVHNFINVEFVKRHLKRGWSSIVKSAFWGIPLPLCSCSVIPTAIMLRKNGAGNGATSSFLISTPESGVDSIAMTYAMMDIPMTIIRPIAAFISAVSAGATQLLFNSYELSAETVSKKEGTCCKKKDSPSPKIKKMLRFSFIDLIDDMALWLGFGLLLGALINWVVPADWFSNLSGFWGRMIILGLGIPTYICASATTPIAASLIIKGMSPGMALLILLVGPATNSSNIMVLQKYIGKRGVVINIVMIAMVALIASYGVDLLYNYYQWPLDFQVGRHTHDHAEVSWFRTLSAVVLSVLIVKGIVLKNIIPYITRNQG